MEQNIFRYTWRYSKRQQIWLLVVVLASLPFYFLSLDLPKRIINGPLQGEGFSSPADTETGLRIAIDLPEWLFGGASVTFFEGFEFGRMGTLAYLCLLFLAFVLINGYFKYYISTFKGRTGERMLRRLRFELYHRLLRFPLGHFKKTSSSEIIPMITAEVEPLGGFIGEAFAVPAFQGGQLLTLLAFMFIQDWVLGLAAVAL